MLFDGGSCGMICVASFVTGTDVDPNEFWGTDMP